MTPVWRLYVDRKGRKRLARPEQIPASAESVRYSTAANRKDARAKAERLETLAALKRENAQLRRELAEARKGRE
jgi:hypothetical protein